MVGVTQAAAKEKDKMSANTPAVRSPASCAKRSLIQFFGGPDILGSLPRCSCLKTDKSYPLLTFYVPWPDLFYPLMHWRHTSKFICSQFQNMCDWTLSKVAEVTLLLLGWYAGLLHSFLHILHLLLHSFFRLHHLLLDVFEAAEGKDDRETWRNDNFIRGQIWDGTFQLQYYN